MCILCGNIDHQDLSLIQKAISMKKGISSREKPKFKSVARLEKQLKEDFDNTIKDSLKEINEII